MAVCLFARRMELCAAWPASLSSARTLSIAPSRMRHLFSTLRYTKGSTRNTSVLIVYHGYHPNQICLVTVAMTTVQTTSRNDMSIENVVFIVPLRTQWLNSVVHMGLGATPVMELMNGVGKAVLQLQREHGLAIDRVYTGSFMFDMAGFSISIMKSDSAILHHVGAPTKAPYWPVAAESNNSIGMRSCFQFKIIETQTHRQKLACWCEGRVGVGSDGFPATKAHFLHTRILPVVWLITWLVRVSGDRPPSKILIPLPPSPSMRNELVLSQPQELNEQGYILEATIETATDETINRRDELYEWDGKVGDGDFGVIMHMDAAAIPEDLKNCYPPNDAEVTANEIGGMIGRTMGGTNGIVYDISCKSVYAKLKGSPTITPNQFSKCGAVAGHRTMLDALDRALSVLKERPNAGDEHLTTVILSSDVALQAAESTKHRQGQAGGSSYVAVEENLASVPDPGAMAAAAMV